MFDIQVLLHLGLFGLAMYMLFLALTRDVF